MDTGHEQIRQLHEVLCDCEDFVKTLDATKSTNQFAGSKLKLNMELNKVLSQWM